KTPNRNIRSAAMRRISATNRRPVQAQSFSWRHACLRHPIVWIFRQDEALPGPEPWIRGGSSVARYVQPYGRLSTRWLNNEVRVMPDIHHSITIDASVDRVKPLVASAEGFSAWWAEDVSRLPASDAVELGFFDRSTVYRLVPKTDPQTTRWL